MTKEFILGKLTVGEISEKSASRALVICDQVKAGEMSLVDAEKEWAVLCPPRAELSAKPDIAESSVVVPTSTSSSNDGAMFIGIIIAVAILIFAVISVMNQKAERQHDHDVYGPQIDSELRRRGVSNDAIREQRQEQERIYDLKPYGR